MATLLELFEKRITRVDFTPKPRPIDCLAQPTVPLARQLHIWKAVQASAESTNVQTPERSDG